MSEAKPMIEQRWVYIGRRAGAAPGVTLDVFQPIVDGLVDEAKRYPYKSARRARTIGGIYALQAAEDGSTAQIKGAKFEEMYPDAERCSFWRVENDAAELERDCHAREQKGKDLNLRGLDGIRKAYMRAGSSAERIRIEVLVLKYLRMVK